MERRRTTHPGTKGTPVDRPRSPGAVNARTASGLRAIVHQARGLTCDVRGVALDEQSGKLHVPLLESGGPKAPPVGAVAGELIVGRVEEFLIEGPAHTRWFELGGLDYEPGTRRVSIGPGGRSQFALTVEALDVTLRIRPPTQSRP